MEDSKKDLGDMLGAILAELQKHFPEAKLLLMGIDGAKAEMSLASFLCPHSILAMEESMQEVFEDVMLRGLKDGVIKPVELHGTDWVYLLDSLDEDPDEEEEEEDSDDLEKRVYH